MKEKCILICEDDEGVTDIAQIVLEARGYSVVVLGHSNNLYATIDRVQPDLLLLDLWMPEVSGEEAVRQLKENERTKHIPIVIMSANNDGASIASQSGAEGFLAKPFDLQDLETIVEEYLNANAR